MEFASGCPTVALWASPLLVEVFAIAVVDGGVPPSPPPPQAATRTVAVTIRTAGDLLQSLCTESPCNSGD